MVDRNASARHVNLKLLHTFMIVAEHRSFREAADQVHRSQSAISTQIKLLEEQLGISLFNRTTRHVQLTDEGRAFLDYARRSIEELEFGLRNILEMADLRRGRVTIACAPTIAATRLPPILALFETDHPGIRIAVHELKSVELFDRLRKASVDFAVGPVVPDGDFDFKTIIREPIHAMGSKRFFPKDLKRISFEKLADLPLIQFPTTTVMGSLIADTARKRSLQLNIRYECVQGQTLLAMAKAGLGVALMTKSVIMEGKTSDMRRPLVVDPFITQSFGIITLKGKRLSPAASELLTLLKSHMSD